VIGFREWRVEVNSDESNDDGDDVNCIYRFRLFQVSMHGHGGELELESRRPRKANLHGHIYIDDQNIREKT